MSTENHRAASVYTNDRLQTAASPLTFTAGRAAGIKLGKGIPAEPCLLFNHGVISAPDVASATNIQPPTGLSSPDSCWCDACTPLCCISAPLFQWIKFPSPHSGSFITSKTINDFTSGQMETLQISSILVSPKSSSAKLFGYSVTVCSWICPKATLRGGSCRWGAEDQPAPFHVLLIEPEWRPSFVLFCCPDTCPHFPDTSSRRAVKRESCELWPMSVTHCVALLIKALCFI